MATAYTLKDLLGTDAPKEELFDFPFLANEQTVEFLRIHDRIMFIIRGPPGSAKSTLSDYISELYPKTVVCCANDYFKRPFQKSDRNSQTIRESHLECQRKVDTACQKEASPVVVKNTHTALWELQPYFRIAKRYHYTVIMAITLRKLVVTAATLEQTNRYLLAYSYLQRRISDFQECVPSYLGWFLCPDDQSFLLQETKLALKNLLGDGKFCNFFASFNEGEIWQQFEARESLFCIATFCNKGNDKMKRKFYVDDAVQNVYGKCFSLLVGAFFVTKNSVWAIVRIAKNMKFLVQKYPGVCYREEVDQLGQSFSRLGLEYQPPKMLDQDFSSSGKTVELKDLDYEIDANSTSFIHVAQSPGVTSYINDVQRFAFDIFEGVIDERGIIEDSKYSVLDDERKYIRLKKDSWIILLDKQIRLSAVLTGQYFE